MEVFEMDGPWQGNPSGYVHHDAWWGFLHLLPFVVLLVLIGAPARDAAVEELRIRYARGELGRDDFAQRMRDLGHPDIAPARTTAGGDDAPTSPEGDAPAGSG
jgi:hypothetical protein